MRVFRTSPKNPDNELMLIIKSEVPTAVLNGKPVSSTNAGIIRNPPPAPTSPVRNPIKTPSRITRNTRNRRFSEVISLRSLIMATEAMIIRTAKMPSSKILLVNSKGPIWNKTSGMDGTIHLRVQKMLRIDGRPNKNPVRIFTKCSLYFGTAPAKLVTPTINSE